MNGPARFILPRLATAAIRPQPSAALLGAGSASMLAAAAVFEHGFGLAPCIMCLWQRWPHWLVVFAAVAALLLGRSAKGAMPHRLALGLMAVALLAGAGIAFWHVGVEQGLLPGPAACGGAVTPGLDPAAALDELLETPTVQCDQVAWSVLGLSMAAWNGLISLAMVFLACRSLFRYHVDDHG